TWKIPQRNFERTGGETELDGRATQRLQAGAIGGGVTKLTDARQADLSPVVPANHSQTGRAAIHLIYLLNVLEAADPFLPLAEKSLFVCKWFRAVLAFLALRRGLLFVERDLVMHRGFSRKIFDRKIKRDARFSLGLILREPFRQQIFEFRELPF